MFSRRVIVKSLKLWNLLLSRVSLAVGLHECAYTAALRSLRHRDPAELNIVFLCTGNICRSPYAELRFKKMLADQGLTVRSISSFGLETEAGKIADSQTQRLAMDRGIDLSQHRTQPVAHENLANADLIVVMEPIHFLRLQRIGKNYLARAILLGSLLAPEVKNPQIPDPFGRSEEVRFACFDLIDKGLNRLIERLFAN